MASSSPACVHASRLRLPVGDARRSFVEMQTENGVDHSALQGLRPADDELWLFPVTVAALDQIRPARMPAQIFHWRDQTLADSGVLDLPRDKYVKPGLDALRSAANDEIVR
jgi:hypothetical protein